MAFVFTYTNNKLQVSNGNVDPEVKISFTNPIPELAGDKIFINDNFGRWERTLRIEDFGTISGVTPTDIEDAYNRLKTIQDTINSTSGGGGGTLPTGPVNLDVIDVNLSGGQYTFPSDTYYSATIYVTSGTISINGSTNPLPEGVYPFSAESGETLNSFTIDQVDDATMSILVQSKP